MPLVVPRAPTLHYVERLRPELLKSSSNESRARFGIGHRLLPMRWTRISPCSMVGKTPLCSMAHIRH